MLCWVLVVLVGVDAWCLALVVALAAQYLLLLSEVVAGAGRHNQAVDWEWEEERTGRKRTGRRIGQGWRRGEGHEG